MENISPSLRFLWDVKRALNSGKSVRAGIERFLQRKTEDVFYLQVQQWWLAKNNEKVYFDDTTMNTHRRHLLLLLGAGLRGQSVLPQLINLEQELVFNIEEEIGRHIEKMPMLMLLPMLLLIFPATMMLLLVPLLKMLNL